MQIKQLKTNLVLFILLAINVTCINANDLGNVVIHDKDTIDSVLNTVSKAALLLESDNRGLLLPRLTYTNMNAIREPKDGLLLYVIRVETNDKREEGFWFYDGDLDIWRRLKEMKDSTGLSEPLGSIVAYTGDMSLFDQTTGLGILGTEAQGWALCNGYDGRTPDLSERFIVGATTHDYDYSDDYDTILLDEVKHLPNEYEIVGDTGGQNYFHVEEENIPTHSHGTETLNLFEMNHSHHIDNHQHNHTYTGAYGWNGDEIPARAASGDIPTTFSTETAKTEKITFSQEDLTVHFSLPDGCVRDFGADSPDNIDNRPEFYAVAFIMKVGFGHYTELPINGIQTTMYPVVEIFKPNHSSEQQYQLD